MWKWVLGAIAAVIVLLAAGMCYGIRKVSSMASGQGETTTMIGASPARVFASLADGDSIGDWMTMGGAVRPSRHGQLRVGDTLHVTQIERLQGHTWIVSEVTPGRSLAVQLRNDSVNFVMVARRFALEARGDSTALIATVSSPLVDSATAVGADMSTERALIAMTAKLMLGTMRMQSQLEIRALKARAEGMPIAAPGRGP